MLRTQYDKLFGLIGTKFGAVDEAHFNLPNLHHRFIEGTTSLSEVGSYVEAGLPNNYGVFTFARGGAANGTSGGFYYNNSPCTKKYSMSEAEAGVTGTELNFNATQCSSLYGGSSTVQPAGLYGLLLIRAYEV